VVESVREQARRERYEAALTLRDETAAALREEYTDLVTRLTDLLARLEACERTVVLANRDRPKDTEVIEPAETIARGCAANFTLGANTIAPLGLIARLGVFDAKASVRALAWPPAEPLQVVRPVASAAPVPLERPAAPVVETKTEAADTWPRRGFRRSNAA
jgi:hypothetical protein